MKKVVLAFPVADGQTGVAIKDAFEQLGWQVRVVDAKLEPDKTFDAVQEMQPDLVFCSRTIELASQIRAIKKRLPPVVSCVWNPDVRDDIDEWGAWMPLFREVTYYFTVSESRANRFHHNVNKNSFYLPQGIQPEVYRKAEDITDADREKFGCDVMFAGSQEGIHSWRREYLEALENISGIKVLYWGCANRPRIVNDDHNKAVACSKICLGMSGWQDATKYTSVRDYKILGAGGFLLTRKNAELDRVFCTHGIRQVCDMYETPDELAEKVMEWLNPDKDEERNRVAQMGHRWVHRQATYKHRIEKALRIMGVNSE